MDDIYLTDLGLARKERDAAIARVALLDAEIVHLRMLYDHNYNIARDELARALRAEAKNRHLIEELATANGKIKELHRLAAEAAELIDYSEKRGMFEYATRCAAWLDMWSSHNPGVISRR